MIEAAAWAGLSEKEFWETTPRYFVAIINGKQRDERERWTMTRQQSYWTILPHIGKKQLKPTALGVFAWEESKIKTKELTPEIKANINKFKEMALRLLQKNE